MSSQIYSNPKVTGEKVNDLVTAFSLFAKVIRGTTKCCIPGVVKSYNRTEHKATITPLVKLMLKEGNETKFTEQSDFNDITVFRIRQGGFTIDVPLQVGDTGWLIASDRDTSLVKQMNNTERSDGPQNTPSLITHDFNSGFFIPDCWGTTQHPSESDGLVISTTDGKGSISISAGGDITIKAANSISMEATDVNINGKVNVTGGDITVAGGDVVSDGISLKHHTHTVKNHSTTSEPVAT